MARKICKSCGLQIGSLGLRAAFHKDKSALHLSAGRSSLQVRSRPVLHALHALVTDTGPKNQIPEGLLESPFEVATMHHVANSKGSGCLKTVS